MIISLIVAMDKKGGIGENSQLPWHLPSDLKRFKQLTMGHCLVMGRKTYETIGKPLPGRVMIIVTRQLKYVRDGCFVVHSLEEAIQFARNRQETELFIIGGGQIFSQALPQAERIYLTQVDVEIYADVYFPPFDRSQWDVLSQAPVVQAIDEPLTSSFQILQRKKQP